MQPLRFVAALKRGGAVPDGMQPRHVRANSVRVKGSTAVLAEGVGPDWSALVTAVAHVGYDVDVVAVVDPQSRVHP